MPAARLSARTLVNSSRAAFGTWLNGARAHLLLHAEKIGQRPFNSWVQLPGRWTLVTDSTATPDQLDSFRTSGIEVIVVPLP